MRKNKLALFAFIAFLIYLLLVNFSPTPISYPFPERSEEELFQDLKRESNALRIPYMGREEVQYADMVANSSIGRFVENQQITREKLQQLQAEIPLYTFQLDDLYRIYELNPETGKLVTATNIFIPIEENNPEPFITSYFGEGYAFQSKEISEDSLFTEWDLKRTYTKDTAFSSIKNVVEIYTIDNNIVQFKQYGLADGFPIKKTETIGEIILTIIILLFLFILFVIVTIQLIKRIIKKQIQSFAAPFLLSITAGIGWFFITHAMGSSITGVGFIEPALFTYLTFGILLIRWKKSSLSRMERWGKLKASIWIGFLTAIIAITLSELFFVGATQFFDAWISPVLNFNVLLQINIWLLPIFTLFIGLSAAITEEAIFRHYMIPFFNRFGIFISILATSTLWGILHIGYDMYPWYLYVIDFLLITGPFFYFVYKRYGFQTVIFMHFFYNSWVTTLFLFSVDLKIALLSLLITLSPLSIFLYTRK